MQLTMIKPNTHVPFIPKHKPVLFTFAFLAFFSIIYAAFIVSPNWGTSFQGGTSITLHFDQDVSTEKVRQEFVDDPRFESVSVQQIGSEDARRYVVRTRTTTTLNCVKLDEVKNSITASISSLTGGNMTIGQWPNCNPEIEDGIRGDFFMSLVAVEGKQAPETLPDQAAIQKAFDDAKLAAVVSYEETSNRFLVKPTGIQTEVLDLMAQKFPESFNQATGLDQIDSVGADVGEKFRTDSLVSILVALGLMLLYIGIRFDTRFAPAAVISLTVTTLMTFGVVVVLQLEITLETVAAFLSLVGYGINDTIVTFDRVRENVGLAEPGKSLAEIVNNSINECLSRTIITTLTTLAAIFPLCIHATGATQDFAIIMFIGCCIATVNSMFISCPMLLYFDKWYKNIQKNNELRKEIAELNENGAEI